MSMLADFLDAQSISTDSVVAASQALERHGLEERDLKVKRINARRTKKSYEEAEANKPDGLGRGLSQGTLRRALDGKPVSRIVRKKIVRAVNDSLGSAKKEPITWRELFADVPVRRGKPKKGKK